MKNFKIIDFGCKLNQYESQLMRELLLKAGFTESDEKPDIFIINSCCVTQRAENKTKEILRKLRRKFPSSKLILCGCLVNLYGKENLKDLADILIKNEEKYKILKFLGKPYSDSEKIGISYFKNHTRAFVKIQTGCDNFCSFCVIPYVRGRPTSRSKEEILDEVKRLLDSGYKEVVLSGVCLGKYGKDFGEKFGLLRLLEEITKLKANFRVRLSSIEPQDVNSDLVEFISQNEKMCNHLHIPFQSGDDKVLKSMNRKCSVSDYLKICETVKEKIKGASITTDIIVGFPTEKIENFENTIRFLKKVLPLKVHIFSFSKRPLTPHFNESVDVKEIKRRRKVLEEVCNELSLNFRKNFLNQTLRVLFEVQNCQFKIGLSDNYIKVFVKEKNDIKLNEFSQVKITQINQVYTYAQKV